MNQLAFIIIQEVVKDGSSAERSNETLSFSKRLELQINFCVSLITLFTRLIFRNNHVIIVNRAK